MTPTDASRPAASVDQLKALAHPVRLRILRLCLEQELTNKALAEALGLAPGTVLRHVRALLHAGFLAPGEVRTGKRGAMERPYRSTGVASTLAIHEAGNAELSREVELAVVAAHRAELAAAPPGAVRSQIRWKVRLAPAALAELVERVEGVIAEYGDRDDRDGVSASLLWSLHETGSPDDGTAGTGDAVRN